MQRVLTILIFLIFLLAVPTVAAQVSLVISESDSYVVIAQNSVHEKIILKYVVSQISEYSLTDSIYVYGSLSNVEVYDSQGRLSKTLTPMDDNSTRIMFYLRPNLVAGDRCTVTVEFDKATENSGNYIYRIDYRWSVVPVSYKVVAKLPQGYTLLGSTENYVLHTEESGDMYLRWFGTWRSRFRTILAFSVGAQSQEEEKAPIPYLPLLAVSVASLITIVGLWKFRALRKAGAVRSPEKLNAPPKKPEVPKEEVKRILRMFTDNEGRIVEELLKENNLTQTELCGKTDIPKATMSRVLQSLEHKGVVKRVGYGISKKVILTKWAKRWRTE